MKQIRKHLALFLALVMCLSFLGAGALAADEDLTGQIVILHTNDMHSRVAEADSAGLAGVAAAKDYYESLGAYVLLFDVGDMLHGLPMANLSRGSNIVSIMNAVGYDAMAPGNHDFNYTSARLAELAEEMDFPLISSNYTDDATGKTVFEPYAVFDSAELGVKIGVVGITTPETATKSSPLNTQGYSFNGDKLAEIVQEQIDALQDLGCDYIIALGHLGIDSESAPWRSVDVIGEVSGLDLFIDGHSHSSLEDIEEAGYATVADKDGNEIVLTSTGNYLAHIGMVTIDGDSITAGYVTEELEPNEEVAAMISNMNEELKPLLDQVVASTSVFLNGERAPGNRTEETNLGDLCTDALLWASGADIALTNGGGIRVSLDEGDITYGDLNAVYPFGNVVVTINIKGSDVLAALEHGTSAAPEASGGFPQVAGLSFELQLNAAAGSRVKNVMVGEEPLDPDKIYVLATNDFTQIGGDGYDMLAKYPVEGYYGALDEALVDFVSDVLGGDVGIEYAEPAGRIVIMDVPSNWAVVEMNAAIELGLVPWYMQWKYSEATTRAEFAELAVILYETITGAEITDYKAGVFPDTNSVIANKAYAIGVVDGISGRFAGSEPLNREQAATMLARLAAALDHALPEAEMDFADSASVSNWAAESVGKVQAAKIMTGDAGKFDPKGSYQRQQSIATILRLYNEVADMDTAADVADTTADDTTAGDTAVDDTTVADTNVESDLDVGEDLDIGPDLDVAA